MSDCAAYKKMDFVDYFAHMTNVLDEHLSRLVRDPKCLAVIHAFVSGKMRLAAALGCLGDNFEALMPDLLVPQDSNSKKKKYNMRDIALIKQMARRYALPPKDARSIAITDDTRDTFKGLCRAPLMTKLEFMNWLENDAAFECYALDSADTWLDIRARDEQEYLWYWEVANADGLRALLCNREFVAGLEACYARKAEQELDDIFGMIDDLFAAELSMLSITLRFKLYGHLSYQVAVGIIQIPQGLRNEFSDFYRVGNEG